MGEYYSDDTIVAIATPVGEGGISVIRVSGPDAWKMVGQVFRSKDRKKKFEAFPPNTIHFGYIVNEKEEILDQILLSLFREPNSYTGEDIIEISAHGGIAITKRILDLLMRNGARHAAPGEFTKRAFLNGKIDLTQAEAVLDLIKAKSQRSLDVAMRQLTGSLSKKLKSLKNLLMKLYAHMEAYLDFPEEDIEVFSDKELLRQFASIRKEIEELLQSFKRSAILREGISVVIVGKPNVGKSSLFNALLERDRALVSPYPGTTRDHLEEALEIHGVYIRLMDTAGLNLKAQHPLDQIGMERTRRMLQEAQLFLYMVDGSEALDAADQATFLELAADKPVLVLVNKCDLEPKMALKDLDELTGKKDRLMISSKTRTGFESLENKIIEIIFGKELEIEGEQITKLRHKNALEKSLKAIHHAEESFVQKLSLEFVTLDLKSALDALSELIGEVYSEDLLDVIFSEFCVGK